MTAAPLNLAAIMAEHKYVSGEGCYECEYDGTPAPWPCVPYRLAADLAATQTQLHEALEAIGAGATAHAADKMALAAARSEKAALELMLKVDVARLGGACDRIEAMADRSASRGRDVCVRDIRAALVGDPS